MKKQKDFKEGNIKDIMMKSVHIRTWMNIIATIIGVAGIILIKLFDDWSLTILWIEIIVLPSIYLIGNAYIEEKIKGEYSGLIQFLEEKVEGLNDDLMGYRATNQHLINVINDYINNGKTKKQK